jgi:hypothetical protein
LGEQPVEGADALFELAVFGLGVDVVPEGVAQGRGEGVAVGQAGQPVGPAEGFGEPAGHPQVLGLRGQQGLAQPDHAPPVGLLDVGHPLALGEGGVVEAAGFLDLVEGGRKAQVVAAGLVGEGSAWSRPAWSMVFASNVERLV